MADFVDVPTGREEPCPKAKFCSHWPHGPAQFPHSCPFKHEIRDDDATLCECCLRCEDECSRDV